MVSQVIKSTFENVYKDDFKDSDHYHRILFSPARAVQSRELTQMQTIIQREIERFGRNIFKEGAAVNPVRNVYVDRKYAFVKLQSATVDASNLNLIFTGQTSGVKGKIVEIVNAEGADPTTLYVAYSSGNPSSSGESNVKFLPGETIVGPGGTPESPTFVVQSTNTDANPATGFGMKAYIGEGEFFVAGHFIYVQQSSKILSKYSNTTTSRVGFKVIESIVTVNDNANLYDNSQDNLNTTAPGADRLQITVELVLESEIAAGETFIYIADIRDGDVIDVNDGRDEYNRILDLLAQRTFEESGNYTVKPFLATFNAGDSSGELDLKLTSGIAYVEGYRVEQPSTTIKVQKPRSTTARTGDTTGINYGNYVNVSDLLSVPDLSNHEKLNLMDDSDYISGSIIGTARIRAIETVGSDYRFHLFDIQMNSGQNFRNTHSIGTGALDYGKIILDNGVAVLYETQNNDALFPLTNARAASVANGDLTVQRTFYVTAVGTTAALPALGTGESWTSTSDWLTSTDSDGAFFTPSAITATEIQGVPGNNQAISVHAFVRNTTASSKTKTLTTVTNTISIDSDGNGNVFVPLGKVDIYQLDSARLTNSSGIDIKSKFRLDNGQKDNYYDIGRLYLNTGESLADNSVYVKFQHFAHTNNGYYFSVSSYSGIDYENIPVYRQNNGVSVPLSDVLDFRPTIDETGANFTGTGAIATKFPQNTETVSTDNTYYNSRNDKLVAIENGKISYIKGEESLNPISPDIPDGSMLLYNFYLNPYTLNKSDLSTQYIQNKRYTMRDIGKIEQRIERTEEMVALSLLDIQASTLEVLDGSGLNRTKSGFLTDDFHDHRASNINSEEHRASINPFGEFMTCSYRTKNVGLIFDSAGLGTGTSGTSLVNNLVMLDYTEELYVQQPEATRTVNLQPFIRINYEGTLILSPSSDEWREEITNTIIVETPRVDDEDRRRDRGGGDDPSQARAAPGSARERAFASGGWRQTGVDRNGFSTWESRS